MIPLREEILGDCEKMAIISSTGNEWPQDQVDENGLIASTSKLMEKTGHQELSQAQQQQQPPLRCPRCDSSNTKFCYYNNYSLSQPRHFCKACKRYWTRGGTLRNVPVGGGCRKNKRVKRPPSSIDGASTLVSTANPNPTSQSPLDIPSTSNHINPLFYGLSNPSEINLPFSGRFTSSRVPSNMEITISGYRDLQSQLNPLALEFSKPGISSATATNAFQHGKQIQDVVSSNSLVSSYSNIFGSSSSSTAAASPTIPTLLASNFEQQKLNNGGIKGSRALDHFQHSNPFANVQMIGHSESGISMKEVKTEQGQNRLPWNIQCLNQMEQIGSSDPSVYWSTSTGVGAWYDPAIMGSSVTSLI